MYHRFLVQGGHTCIAASEAQAILGSPNRESKIHQTPIGTLYSESYSVQDVEVLNNTIRLDREKPKRNHYASDFFGLDVYGDCYLKTIEGLSHLVVPAVCKYERDGKTLAEYSLS